MLDFRSGSSCDQTYHSALVSSRLESRHPAEQAVGFFGNRHALALILKRLNDGQRTAAAEDFTEPRHLVNCTDASQTRRPAPFGVRPVPFFPVSDRGALHRLRRLCGVELPVALCDAASPLVPGNDDADMVRASPLACSDDFPLRLAVCQGKHLIAEGRQAALVTSWFCGCLLYTSPSPRDS